MVKIIVGRLIIRLLGKALNPFSFETQASLPTGAKQTKYNFDHSITCLLCQYIVNVH
jgi:hypothetical protein